MWFCPSRCPPETRMLRRVTKHLLGGAEDLLGQSALPNQVSGRKRASSEAPHRDGHLWAGRGHADGDSGAIGQTRVDDGRRCRIESQRPGNVNGRPLKHRGIKRGRLVVIEPPSLRSIQTLWGPLIISSETSMSSRTPSSPGKKGLRCSIPLARFISGPPRANASSRASGAGSTA